MWFKAVIFIVRRNKKQMLGHFYYLEEKFPMGLPHDGKKKSLDLFGKAICNVSMFSLPKEMIKTYLDRRVTDVLTLKECLQKNSVEEFNRIGHQLLGNAKSYGFPDLESIASQMEDLTTAELQSRGPQLVEQFNQWLQSALQKNSVQ